MRGDRRCARSRLDPPPLQRRPAALLRSPPPRRSGRTVRPLLALRQPDAAHRLHHRGHRLQRAPGGLPARYRHRHRAGRHLRHLLRQRAARDHGAGGGRPGAQYGHADGGARLPPVPGAAQPRRHVLQSLRPQRPLRRDLHRQPDAGQAGVHRRPLRAELPRAGDFGPGEGGTPPMRRGRSGSMAIELAMWLPVMFLLIGGLIQFGKITYIYYSLEKTMTTIASLLAVQNGVNFCPEAGDPTITAAIQWAPNGRTLSPFRCPTGTSCSRGFRISWWTRFRSGRRPWWHTEAGREETTCRAIAP